MQIDILQACIEKMTFSCCCCCCYVCVCGGQLLRYLDTESGFFNGTREPSLPRDRRLDANPPPLPLTTTLVRFFGFFRKPEPAFLVQYPRWGEQLLRFCARL